MRAFSVGGVLISCLAVLGGVAPLVLPPVAVATAADTADQRLADFFRDHLQESFRLRPIEASTLGDHAYDDLLDDIRSLHLFFDTGVSR